MPSVDPHLQRVLNTDDPYVDKRPVQARVVCVLDASSECRGMEVEIHPSRAVPAGEIHELALTDEPEARPGVRVERVAYVGFVEIERGGVILVGDEVTLGGRSLGQVAGFDATHFPNHLNILVRGPERRTGRQLEVAVEEPVTFAMTRVAPPI